MVSASISSNPAAGLEVFVIHPCSAAMEVRILKFSSNHFRLFDGCQVSWNSYQERIDNGEIMQYDRKS